MDSVQSLAVMSPFPTRVLVPFKLRVSLAGANPTAPSTHTLSKSLGLVASVGGLPGSLTWLRLEGVSPSCGSSNRYPLSTFYDPVPALSAGDAAIEQNDIFALLALSGLVRRQTHEYVMGYDVLGRKTKQCKGIEGGG